MTLNLGPQHPASHGVMRLQLELDGEIILHVNPEIGFLHRGTEKNTEYREYLKNAPYFDRFDYVAMMNQSQSYALVVEKLLNAKIPYYAQLIRFLYCELARILSHLLAISTHALDLGAMSAFCWVFEEREKILQIFETISGARMHPAFIRPGGVSHDFNQIWEFQEINDFIDQFSYRLDEIQNILDNPIFINRLKNIGVVSKSTVTSYGLTGVMARASGFDRDLRKTKPYDSSDSFAFQVPITHYGDSYNRYNLRILEIQESLQLIKQTLSELFILWK
jgi:NADH dehydrogenase (ubiquinone) Fe-S protein 2